MRNIAFVINGMGSGGSQKEVFMYSSYFASKGDNVFIISLFDERCFYPLDRRVSLTLMIGPHKNKRKNSFFWRKHLTTFFDTNEITHVIAFGTRFAILCASSVSKSKRKPLLIFKEISTKPITKTDEFFLFYFKKNFSHIVAQTNAQISISIPSFLKSKVMVVPNPFETEPKQLNEKGFEAKRIITIGRLNVPVKRQDVMIKAFAIFHKKHQDFVFDIYGEPQLNEERKTIEYLTKLITSLGLKNAVNLKGTTPNVKGETVNSTMFLLASPKEGMPNSLVESMILGIPAVTSDWAGAQEVVDDGVDGYVVPYGDEQAMADKMELMISSKDKYEAICRQAFLTSNQRYSKNKVFDAWEKQILK
jgi:glycosyltransferase involved in cell wall biosynthesis